MDHRELLADKNVRVHPQMQKHVIAQPIQQSSMGGGPTTVAGMIASQRWLMAVTLIRLATVAGE